MNYLYNGVELPALPEWDRETYPYAVIYCMSGYSSYMLDVCSEKPVRYFNSDSNGYSVGCPNGCQSLYFGTSDTLWNNGQPYLQNDHYSRSWTTKHYPVWANVDILDGDGTVALAASDPVPVYNATEFFNGVALGLSGTGIPAFEEDSCFGKGYLTGSELRRNRPKNIVAYNYNGVPLPDIYTVYTPELQKTHPYAVVGSFPGHEDTPEYFACCNNPFIVGYYVSGEYVEEIWLGDFAFDGGEVFGWMLTDGKWELLGSDAVAMTPIVPVWSGYDVSDIFNNIFLAASDPIPIYE